MRKQKAQAMLEYLLILLVITMIVVGAYRQINDNLFGSSGFMRRYYDAVGSVFSAGQGMNLKYKRFKVRR